MIEILLRGQCRCWYPLFPLLPLLRIVPELLKLYLLISSIASVVIVARVNFVFDRIKLIVSFFFYFFLDFFFFFFTVNLWEIRINRISLFFTFWLLHSLFKFIALLKKPFQSFEVSCGWDELLNQLQVDFFALIELWNRS